VFIAAYAAVTDGSFTFVFWDSMKGPKDKDLTTCIRDVGVVSFVAKGFFTPRH
jgi:hypothetical protein